MHKVFEIIRAEKVNTISETCSEYLLTLKRSGKMYQIKTVLSNFYKSLKYEEISFKDDSWLDENLKELK